MGETIQPSSGGNRLSNTQAWDVIQKSLNLYREQTYEECGKKPSGIGPISLTGFVNDFQNLQRVFQNRRHLDSVVESRVRGMGYSGDQLNSALGYAKLAGDATEDAYKAHTHDEGLSRFLARRNITASSTHIKFYQEVYQRAIYATGVHLRPGFQGTASNTTPEMPTPKKAGSMPAASPGIQTPQPTTKELVTQKSPRVGTRKFHERMSNVELWTVIENAAALYIRGNPKSVNDWMSINPQIESFVRGSSLGLSEGKISEGLIVAKLSGLAVVDLNTSSSSDDARGKFLSRQFVEGERHGQEGRQAGIFNAVVNVKRKGRATLVVSKTNETEPPKTTPTTQQPTPVQRKETPTTKTTPVTPTPQPTPKQPAPQKTITVGQIGLGSHPTREVGLTDAGLSWLMAHDRGSDVNVQRNRVRLFALYWYAGEPYSAFSDRSSLDSRLEKFLRSVDIPQDRVGDLIEEAKLAGTAVNQASLELPGIVDLKLGFEPPDTGFYRDLLGKARRIEANRYSPEAQVYQGRSIVPQTITGGGILVKDEQTLRQHFHQILTGVPPLREVAGKNHEALGLEEKARNFENRITNPHLRDRIHAVVAGSSRHTHNLVDKSQNDYIASARRYISANEYEKAAQMFEKSLRLSIIHKESQTTPHLASITDDRKLERAWLLVKSKRVDTSNQECWMREIEGMYTLAGKPEEVHNTCKRVLGDSRRVIPHLFSWWGDCSLRQGNLQGAVDAYLYAGLYDRTASVVKMSGDSSLLHFLAVSNSIQEGMESVENLRWDEKESIIAEADDEKRHGAGWRAKHSAGWRARHSAFIKLESPPTNQDSPQRRAYRSYVEEKHGKGTWDDYDTWLRDYYYSSND